MGKDQLEYRIKGASKVPLFIVYTVVGALVVIIIIQPMGPVLGIGTITIFLGLWAWFLTTLIRDILNKPKSIVFGDDGIIFTTRRESFRIAWGDVASVVEMSAPAGPRSSTPVHRFSILSQNAPEIWFSEYMLHARGAKTTEENYAHVKEYISRHVPAEKLRFE